MFIMNIQLNRVLHALCNFIRKKESSLKSRWSFNPLALYWFFSCLLLHTPYRLSDNRVECAICWNFILIWVFFHPPSDRNLFTFNRNEKKKSSYCVTWIRQWQSDHPNNNLCIEFILITINFWSEFDLRRLLTKCSFVFFQKRMPLN